ncbi:hypothetical protein LBMAG42_31440 [Deltaproteobacteria bacterium]|nr:hypothetical protein LBMAG42_31440 [Deltaproteobacteria bacterium]
MKSPLSAPWTDTTLRLLVYALSAVFTTWPLATAPAALAVGGPRTDVYNALWSYWFVAQGLAEGRFPMFTTLLDYPTGGRLLVADPLNAALAVPITLLAGPTAAYAGMILLHLTLGAFFADQLGRRLGGRGWIAGLAWAWAPIVRAHLQNGSSEAAASAWLPLAGLLVVGALTPGSTRRRDAARMGLAGLGLALAAVGGGWYAGLGAFVFAGAFTLLHPQGRRLWPALLVGALLLLPVAGAYHALSNAPDGLVDIKDPEILSRLRRTVGAADPRTFFMPGDFRSPDFARLEQNPSDLVHTAYLGFVLLGLALWKGRERALWITVVVAVVLAMGPVLVIAGGPVPWHMRALPLPYAALEGLPGFDGLSLLFRIATVAPLALGLLADRAPPWLGALIVAETLALSPARSLPMTTDAGPPAPLVVLAAAPEGAVISLPAGYARTRLFEQSVHHHPLTASLNSGVNAAGLRVLADLRKVVNHELEWPALVAAAQAQGVRYVVVHPKVPIEATFQTSIRAIKANATVLAKDGERVVYSIW